MKTFGFLRRTRRTTNDKAQSVHRTKRWKKLLLVLIGPGLFVLAEVLLRIAGFTADAMHEDPYFTLTAESRAYKSKEFSDGSRLYVCRTSRRIPFFYPSFAMPKPEGTLRIVIAGGSAPAGFPYDGRVAFGEWLKAGLDAVRLVTLSILWPVVLLCDLNVPSRMWDEPATAAPGRRKETENEHDPRSRQ